MTQESGGKFKPKGKDWAIIVLAAAVLVQGYLLVRGGRGFSRDAAAPAASTVVVKELILDSPKNQHLLAALSEPLGANRTGALPDDAGAIEPALPGAWSFLNPYTLMFSSNETFQPRTRYEIRLNPKALDTPAYAVDAAPHYLETTPFELASMHVEERSAPGGGAETVLAGRLQFNEPVSPKELLNHLSLRDPERNATVELSLETFYNTRSPRFVSAPVTKTAKERVLILSVDKGLTPAGSDVLLGQPYEWNIPLQLDPDLRLDQAKAESQPGQGVVTLRFSSPVAASAAAAAVSVSPEVDFQTASSGQEVTLSGAFLPRKTYTVVVAQGLAAEDGAALHDRIERKLSMPDVPPRLDFQGQGMFLAREGAQALALQTVNVNRVELSIDRVYRNNLFLLFQNYGYSVFGGGFSGDVAHVLGGQVASRLIRIQGKPNEEARTVIDLNDAMRKGGRGLYKVSAKLPNTWEGVERWVLSTDIGLAAKEGGGELLIWAASFSEAKPLRNVAVSLLSDQNQVIGQGRTDASGLTRIKLPPEEAQGRPFMVLAEKGADMSFLLPDQFQDDMAGLPVGGQEISRKGYSAFLYGERNIYRPGEKVEAMAIVRDERLKAPVPSPLILEHRDPQGRLLSRRTATPDLRGMAALTVDLPEYALTGTHTLDLLLGEESIGQYRFQVEDFIPDRIHVRIDPEKSAAEAGKRLRFKVEGDYLFGAPAADLRVSTFVRLVPETFTSSSFPDYVFEGPQAFDARKIMDAEAVLDAQGLAGFEADIPSGLKPPSALRAEIAATVLETGGRGVSAMKPVVAHAYPVYVGLKRLVRQGYQPGEEVKLQYATVAPDGAPAAPGKLTAELYKDRWRTIMRRTPSGGFRYESVRDAKLMESKQVGTQGQGEFEMSAPDVGAYRVVLRDSHGAATQVSFFAGGYGYSPWALSNPARLEVVPDKSEYAPGETAKVQLRTPFPGEVLVTVEQRGVKRAQVVEIKGNTAEVRIPVEASDSPNVYVCATLVRPAGDLAPGEAARAIGAAPLFVDRESHRLATRVSAPEEVRPETGLVMEARTKPGARVTIAAVDEGILQLIDQKTPDPFDFFYAKRSLGVRWMDSFSLLLPDLATHKAAPGGGEAERMGRFMNADSLRRVKPVAFFSGVLTADKKGVARFKVDVPDFQGALRVMAVSADKNDFGSSQTTVRVKSPLVLTPSFPRFLGTDEELVIPVSLRNDTPEDGNFTVRLSAEGSAVAADPVQSISVAKGTQETVRFALKTGDGAGVVKLTAQAEGNKESSRASAELPLRGPLPYETVAQAGSLDNRTTVFPSVQADRYAAGTVSRELAVGRLPMVRFTHNLRELLGYPYGCAEQTVSRAFPLIRFGDLAKALAPGLLDKTDPAALVQSAIGRLCAMQAGDGLAMWPGGEEPDAYVSIYAAHFLASAKQAGFHVPDFLLHQLLGFIRGETRPGRRSKAPELFRASYACYVLALAGQADRGAMDSLRAGLGADAPRSAKILLAGSYALAGETKVFQEMLTGLALLDAPSDTRKQDRENLGSPLRDAALTLAALVRTDPSDPMVPELAAKVASMLEARPSYSTQENAFGLMALGAWYGRQSLAGVYAGKALVEGEMRAAFNQDAPLSLAGLPGDAGVAVVLDKTPEPGTIFYSLETRGAPSLNAYQPVSAGIAASRRLLDKQGRPLTPLSIQQGDLAVLEVSAQSQAGPVDNVVVSCLLPAGLEVENGRLASRETLPWVEQASALQPDYVDTRDDRVLIFTRLPEGEAVRAYVLLRAVTEGVYTLPPVRAESMYDPSLVGSGEVESVRVTASR
ncbi:MAG: alpha-2-macroglobulin [Desulfovibrionaceae bacterium]